MAMAKPPKPAKWLGVFSLIRIFSRLVRESIDQSYFLPVFTFGIETIPGDGLASPRSFSSPHPHFDVSLHAHHPSARISLPENRERFGGHSLFVHKANDF